VQVAGGRRREPSEGGHLASLALAPRPAHDDDVRVPRGGSDHEPADAPGDDAELDRRVHDAAFDSTAGLTSALPFVMLPLTAAVALFLREEISAVRATVWIAAAAVATLVGVVARIRAGRSRRIGGRVPRGTVAVVAAALAACATVAGLGPWVAADGDPELVLLFTLFPATCSAAGVITCAGRRDLYAAYTVPLTLTSSAGLVSTGEPRLVALAGIGVAYAFAVAALFEVLHRSTLAAIRVQLGSDRLVAMLEAEREALTTAYEQLAASNERSIHLASHDPLTGLLNRRGTIDALDRLLQSRPHHARLTLLFCDLDRFKSINDSLGHEGGDQFLNVLADRLARTIEPQCLAGRIGGDEFVVVLPDHDTATATAVASRLVGVLAQPVHALGREMPSSVSIGVATFPSHGTTSSDLLRNANAALFRAKRAGRNRVELFDGAMQAEREAELDAEHALRRAIDAGDVLAFFQPEIDASTGRIVGAELLARWLRRDGTVVNAAEFLAMATRAGLLEKLTDRVLSQARPHIRRLASLGLPDGFRFRVNLAPASTDRSWRDDPLDELVRGIDPNLLTVDVRESAVTADLPAAAATLASFRATGGRVCLDGFTRGVSSLSLLRRLPVDEVRIDRQAIDTITAHPHDRAIVRSIIAVVREIGLAVTAEGVETGAQADALIALGCVRQQGHLYARALPAEQFETYLLDRLAEGYVASELATDVWQTGELDEGDGR